MRLQLAFFSSALLIALTSAQSNSTAAPTIAVLPTGTVTLSPAQSSEAACLTACSATDPSCRAACVVSSTPTGNFAAQNATIECISDCFKGNGTAADNLAYENCQKQCVAEASMLPASASTAAMGSGATTAAGSSGAVVTSGSSTSDAGAVATPSSSGSSTSSSKAAAETMHVGMAVAGVAGAFAAVFAL